MRRMIIPSRLAKLAETTSVSYSCQLRMATSSATKPSPTPVRVFVSYSRKEHDWVQELCERTSSLSSQGIIQIWFDSQLTPGYPWSPEIQKELLKSEIVILLLSPNFVDSKYCRYELRQALKLQRRRKTVAIIPLILITAIGKVGRGEFGVGGD